jgi:hypothetical protein
MAVTAIAVALGGCPSDDAPPADPEPQRLALSEDWVYVADAAADPFGAERPAGATCDEQMGLVLEEFTRAFEVKTDLCNYATVQQPSLADIRAGDTIEARMFHFELASDEAAQGHLALAVDGEVVWETFVDIPSDADSVNADIVAERDWPAGTPLHFHVHNHGVNSYNLVSLMVVPAS